MNVTITIPAWLFRDGALVLGGIVLGVCVMFGAIAYALRNGIWR